MGLEQGSKKVPCTLRLPPSFLFAIAFFAGLPVVFFFFFIFHFSFSIHLDTCIYMFDKFEACHECHASNHDSKSIRHQCHVSKEERCL